MKRSHIVKTIREDVYFNQAKQDLFQELKLFRDKSMEFFVFRNDFCVRLCSVISCYDLTEIEINETYSVFIDWQTHDPTNVDNNKCFLIEFKSSTRFKFVFCCR